MSEQPVILPTSARDTGRFEKRFTVRNLVLFAVSLVIVLFLLNAFVGLFNKPEPQAAPPVVATATPEPTVTAEPSPEPTEVTPRPIYDDCAAVWLDLGRPVFQEDQGYRELFDWDANGVGCEDNPATPEDESTVDWTSVRERFRENLDDLGDAVRPKAEEFYDDARNFFSRTN
jgi:hypothetical protein